MSNNFDPWSEVLVAEIAGQKIRAPQYGLRGVPVSHDEVVSYPWNAKRYRTTGWASAASDVRDS